MTRLPVLLNIISIIIIISTTIVSIVSLQGTGCAAATTTSESSTGSSNNVPPIQESLQALFRQTISQWRAVAASSKQQQQQQQWQPWMTFAVKLQQLVEDQQQQQNRNIKLDIIGAYEEGILAIERDIQHKREHEEDAPRDAALSQLYTGYAKLLTLLTPEECLQLALDPHTLLIGAANTVVSSKESNSVPSSNALCLENAINSARNAISLDDTNVQAHELLQSILLLVGNTKNGDDNDDGSSSMRRTEFVAELFDSFADSFDETLVHNLKYKVPELVGDLAKQSVMLRLPRKKKKKDDDDDDDMHYYRAVLDAGCGTGLAGRHLRPLISAKRDHDDDEEIEEGIMIGVDASRKMLDKAALCTRSMGCGLLNDNNNNEHEDNRPLYDKLLQMDLEDMTINNTLGTVVQQKGASDDDAVVNNGFDLVVAADVLVYFANLDSIIRTFASVSRLGAILIFSTEKAATDNATTDNDNENDDNNEAASAIASSLGWRLQSSGRFAHTKQHAIDVAMRHGYNLVSYQEIVPRMEKGEPVQGQLFAFVLNHKDNVNDDEDDVIATGHVEKDQQQHGNEL